MKTKIKLHETLHQSGCPDCYPGIVSATPIERLCDDLYEVSICLDEGHFRFEMTAEELSSFGNYEQAKKNMQKHHERCELCHGIKGAHPGRLARHLQDLFLALKQNASAFEAFKKMSAEESEIHSEKPL